MGINNAAQPHYLDARELHCPLPLLKLKQTLRDLAVGEHLRVETTDPGSVRDFEAFLSKSPHTLMSHERLDGVFTFLIRK